MHPIEVTKLSSRGQIVIPKNIRQELGWTAGDHVAVEIVEDMVILRRLSLNNQQARKCRLALANIDKFG